MDLDELLASASPQVTPRSPELEAELRSLVARTEARARPARRRFRLLGAAAVAGGVVALGTGAAAAGLLPEWMTWSTGAGTACQISFEVRATEAGGEGEPPYVMMSDAQKEEVVRAARQYLAGFDYDAIDTDAVVRDYVEREARIRASQPPTERQPKLVGDDLEITAVDAYVVDHLVHHLDAERLDHRAIMVSAGNRCDR